MMDDKLREYQDELAFWLVRLGVYTRDEAERVVIEDPLYNPGDARDRMLMMHEVPYYWAMTRKWGRIDREWHRDPAKWPPTDEIRWAYDRAKEAGEW